MPNGCSKILRCRGTNREFGSVQLAENARLLTDEGCSLSVLNVHKRSSSQLVRFFRLARLFQPGCRFPDAVCFCGVFVICSLSVRYLFVICGLSGSSGLSVPALVAGFRVPFVIWSRLQTRSSHSSLVHITDQGDLRTFPRLPPRLSSKPDYGDQDMVREVTLKHAPHSIKP